MKDAYAISSILYVMLLLLYMLIHDATVVTTK